MARALWSGAISFGLVNIPINMATAVREKSIHFHMLSEDGTCRLRRKLVCPETGKEYDFESTSRGYEIAPDQYVIVTDDELDKIKPEAGRALVITDFVPLDSIDPIYFDRSYYIQPGEGGANAYQLLVATMVESRKVGLAHFVMHERQHLVTLRVRDGVLVLHTMHYADEVIPTAEVRGETAPPKVDKRELAIAHQLVEALTGPFKPEKYHDEYRRKVQEMIEKKSRGEVITAASQEEDIPPTYNLMDALKRSVQEEEKARKKPAPANASGAAGRKTKAERKKKTG